MIRKFAVAVLLALMVAMPARAAVWMDREQWSPAWEERYRNWVRSYWTAEVTHRKDDPLLFGLELDCADAVYTMRIVFAYRHGLPFAINDPRGRAAPLTNRTNEFDKVRERLTEEDENGKLTYFWGDVLTGDKLVRHFIEMVNLWTTTQNLANDTYPIALSAIEPGDIFLQPGKHAYMIGPVSETGALTTLSASTPAEWRPFAEVKDFPAAVPEDSTMRDGYRRFKPAEHLRTPALKVPGASAEQWKIARSVGKDPVAFGLATQQRLAKFQETPAQRIERLFETLCAYVGERETYVEDAIGQLERMAAQGRRCMNVNEYNSYSTPTRDGRIAGMFKVLEAEVRGPDFQLLSPERQIIIGAIYGEGDPAQLRQACPVRVNIFEQRYMGLDEIYRAVREKRFISDPNAPRAHRWGYADGKWVSNCPAFD